MAVFSTLVCVVDTTLTTCLVPFDTDRVTLSVSDTELDLVTVETARDVVVFMEGTLEFPKTTAEVLLGLTVKFENIEVRRSIWEDWVLVTLTWRLGWTTTEVLTLRDTVVDMRRVVAFAKNPDVKLTFTVAVGDTLKDCVLTKVGCNILVVYTI